MIDPTLPVSNWGQALALARACSAIYHDDWQTRLRDVAVQNWGQYLQGQFFDRNALAPRFAIFTFADSLIVVIEGTTQFPQATNVAASYVQATPALLDGIPIVAFPGDVASQVVGPAVQRAAEGRGQIILTGHSLGGMIAEATSLFLFNRILPTDIQTATYGSGAVGGRQFGNQIANLPARRYMATNDPIPCLWPGIFEAPLLNFVTLGPSLASVAIWTQRGGGIELQGGGRSQPATHPALASPIAEFDLAALIWGAAEGNVGAHNIDNYVALLSTIVANEPVGAIMPNNGAVIAPPIPAPERRRMNATPAEVERALKLRRDYVNPIVPQITRNNYFVAQKYAKQWGVTFRGQWISWGMRRRRATHTAFLGNRLLKEYIKVPQAFPDAFVGALQLFLVDAVAGGLGIVPQLQAGPLQIQI